MGMYTRLTFWADFAEDSPAVPVIKSLIDGLDHDRAEFPGHPFFDRAHAWAVLTCSSYYHRTGRTVFTYDDIARAWWLNVDSSLKNYDNEIDAFLGWVAEYDTGVDGFRGFYLYEEDEHPTLIYREDGEYTERGGA